MLLSHEPRACPPKPTIMTVFTTSVHLKKSSCLMVLCRAGAKSMLVGWLSEEMWSHTPLLGPHNKSLLRLSVNLLPRIRGIAVNSVYIAAYGALPVGKYPQVSELDLALDVISDALGSIALDKSAVQGLFTTPNFSNHMGLQGSQVAEAIRISPRVYLEANCGGMAGGAAIRCACNEIALGTIDCAVVYAAEREYSVVPHIEAIAHMPGEGCPVYDPTVQPFGTTTVMWDYACSARRYMTDYGATEEDFALATVRDNENAAGNPLAAFNSERITVADVMRSAVLCSPIRQLHACTSRDGAAALVLLNDTLAREYCEVPVKIAGIGEHHDKSNFIPTDPSTPIDEYVAVTTAAREALARARLDLTQVNVAELYAPVAPQELMIPEDIGWFTRGEMVRGIREGW